LALKEVAAASLFNDISIYGRNIFVDGNAYKSGIHLIAKNPIDKFSAVDVFLKERSRALSHKELSFLNIEIKNVVSLMEKRHAGIADICSFKESLRILNEPKKVYKR
jgi:citrate lyase synthetase